MLDRVLSQFLAQHLAEESAHCARLRQHAIQHNVPILSPLTAQLVRTLTSLHRPKQILEIGTAIGYSGSLMLEVCDAHLYTVESDPQMQDIATANFAFAGFGQRVTLFAGDVRQVLPLASGSFDMILLDGPKGAYAELKPLLMDFLPVGGLLVADDVLLRGNVTGQSGVPPSTLSRKLAQFLREIFDDPRLSSTIVPIDDGISLSVRIK